DPDETTKMIEHHFGSIAARPAPPTVDAFEPVPSEERRVVHPDPHAPQPAIALAYRVPDPIAAFEDYAATVLLSSILIEGEASRLYQRLVKNDRIASHVSGDVGLVAGTFEVRGPSMLHLAAWYPGTPDAAQRPSRDRSETVERPSRRASASDPGGDGSRFRRWRARAPAARRDARRHEGPFQRRDRARAAAPRRVARRALGRRRSRRPCRGARTEPENVACADRGDADRAVVPDG